MSKPASPKPTNSDASVSKITAMTDKQRAARAVEIARSTANPTDEDILEFARCLVDPNFVFEE